MVTKKHKQNVSEQDTLFSFFQKVDFNLVRQEKKKKNKRINEERVLNRYYPIVRVLSWRFRRFLARGTSFFQDSSTFLSRDCKLQSDGRNDSSS